MDFYDTSPEKLRALGDAVIGEYALVVVNTVLQPGGTKLEDCFRCARIVAVQRTPTSTFDHLIVIWEDDPPTPNPPFAVELERVFAITRT